MLLHKTALAHSALHAGSSAGLSLAERRILIVVDGKRTLDEVVALLGPDILPTLDRLRKDGYLQHAASRVAPALSGGGVGGALTGLLRATWHWFGAAALTWALLRSTVVTALSGGVSTTVGTR